jgi:hypothetical protein
MEKASTFVVSITNTLILLFSLTAFGQVNNIEGKYGVNTEMPTNYVRNKSCISNPAYITGTGTTSQNTSPPVLSGKADCAIDDASSGLTHKWQTLTFDRKLDGGNCEAKFTYKGDASLYKAYVNVGGNKVTTDLQLSNASNPQIASINFPCGLYSDAKEVVIESTSASAAAINVVDVYAGIVTNLGYANVNTNWADYTPTFTGFGTVSSSYLRWRRVGDSIEIQGAFNSGSPTATAASITLPNNWTANVAIGGGQDQSIGRFETNSGSATTAKKGHLLIADSSNIVYFAFNDYTPAISGQTHQNGNAFAVNTQLIWINAKVKVNGLTAEQYITKNESANWGYVKFGSAAVIQNSGTFATFNDTSYGTMTFKGCAQAPTTSNDFAVKCPLDAGTYKVSVTGTYGSDSSVDNNRTNCEFLISDGTNTSSVLQTISQLFASGTNRGEDFSSGFSGVFTYASQGTREFKVQARRQFGTGNCFALNNDGFPELIIEPLDKKINVPLLVGSVTSNSIDSERIERVRFAQGTETTTCTSSPCSTYRETGDWVSSVTRSSAGNYVVNINSGIFSSAPVCQCWARAPANRTCSAEATSTSVVAVTATYASDVLGSMTGDNVYVDLLCMGKK